METTLVTMLNQSVSLTALVSGRVYDRRLPNAPTFPAITYQIISEPFEYTQDGLADAVARVQFTCWGRTASSARAVGAEVIKALSGNKKDAILIMLADNRVSFHEKDTDLYQEIVDITTVRSI